MPSRKLRIMVEEGGLLLQESLPRSPGQRYRERQSVYITFAELQAMAAKHLPGAALAITGRPGPTVGNLGEFTITRAMVGQRTIRAFDRVWMVANFLGQIFPSDVGRRVYLHSSGILQAENDTQRTKRQKREAL